MENSPLMILMSYVILGHPEWGDAEIKIFTVFPEEQLTDYQNELKANIKEGRLPISPRNIELIIQKEDISIKSIVNQKSRDADLTVLGFRPEALKQMGEGLFMGLDDIGDVLFINAHQGKELVTG